MTGELGNQLSRSYLSVPADDHRKALKALASEADRVILDLEDAVAPPGKEAARRTAVSILEEAADSGARCIVRVNAAGTPWCHRDVQALAEAPRPPRSIILPKAESDGDLAFLDRLLAGLEAGTGHRIGVHALIESAAGLARVQEIAGASPRLESLILGYADLAASLDRRQDPRLWAGAQDAVVVAARTHQLDAIDGPHLGVSADEEFRQAAEHARAVGFDGKWVIHPRQIEIVNQAFTPTEEELTEARAVLNALEEAATAGTGVVARDGRMLDEAVAVAARRVLARAPGPDGYAQ
jgi:citrate lyase subunit beta / citryl-CoA lyase